MRNLIGKVAFWKNGEILVGLVVLLAGLYVAWQGFAKLRELGTFFASFLPLALPEDVGERLLRSLPLVGKVFINTVGSLAAMLMGCAWAISGLIEAWQAGKKRPEPADVQNPELVAELVRTGHGQYWKSSAPLVRLAGSLLPRARSISPISYEVMGNLFWTSLKVVLVGVGIAVLWQVFHAIPGAVKSYLHQDISLVVPPARPLFVLLGFVVVVHLFIALSLMPFKRPVFVRTREALSISGSNDPSTFFALLEEACKLLDAVGIPPRAAARLATDGSLPVKATLLETTPESLRSVARPAGYFCLPLTFFPLIMGFTRLIHFQRPVDPMPYSEFLTRHLLSCGLEVAFAMALIVVGLHFAEQARRLFGIRRFRSALIFAMATSDCAPAAVSTEEPQDPSARFGAEDLQWKPAHGADDCFANWAREPQASGTFAVDLFWAEAFSESAVNDGPRFVTDLRRSSVLDEAMEHLVKLPFHVAFRLDNRSGSSHVS
jgi:hypothetical protein